MKALDSIWEISVDMLRTDFSELLLPEIPRRVAVQDAAMAGKPVRDYSVTSDATRAFAELTKAVLARIN